MIVIVEGPDNSGKSTLAAWIAARYGMTPHHSGGPVKDIRSRDERLSRLFSMPPPLVFDRFPCISERVYGPTLRGVDLFDDAQGRHWLSMFRDLVRERKALIIYCRAPLDIMLNLKGHRVKEHETAEHVEAVKANALRLIHRYDVVMLGEDHVLYDWTAGGHQWRSLLATYLDSLMGDCA